MTRLRTSGGGLGGESRCVPYCSMRGSLLNASDAIVEVTGESPSARRCFIL
jgi:hypothetical protein